MKLNRAQLLVHDDTALEKFRANHGIPNDIRIERFGPKEDANLVEGNEDRILTMLTVDMLMREQGLTFIALDLVNVYTVVHMKKELGTRFLKGFPNKTQNLVDLAAAPNPLAVQGLPPVPQPVLAITILDKVESSLLEATLLDKCKGKQPSEGLSKRRKKKMGTNTAFTLSPGEQTELWKPKFSISSGSLALALAFMLPNDVVDLATKQAKLDAVATEQTENGPRRYCSKARRYMTVTEARGQVARFPEPYSSRVLLDFNEDEYLKEPTDEELERSAEVANPSGDLVLNAAGMSAADGGAFKAYAPPNM
ncbi:hypothetical protein Acr_00g0056550 [Actinidia rufa]|uniref:Uncharacterized protein n=1 Tax=Actinidia rufa TaxID=165716 RepID=A0A7J0DP79_9ERIC|nr:hypothetical protein Acr_00g0056550 [Actinidia rufa]